MGIALKYHANSNSIEIDLPTSKSECNRLLVLQFLSGNAFEIWGLSEAKDTEILRACFEKLQQREDSEMMELDCEDGGTQLRFLMAVCAFLPGKFLLTGTPRLMERPHQELIHSLRNIGAEISNLGDGANGPWQITGGKLNASHWDISMAKSSQFASALLLIAPFMDNKIHLNIRDREASWSYVEMTLATLERVGVHFQAENDSVKIAPGIHAPEHVHAEADWSSAAFIFVAQALRKEGEVLLKGLTLSSIQGDGFIENIMRYEGVLAVQEVEGVRISFQATPWKKNELSINLSNYPDLAPVLVVYFMQEGREVDFYGLESLAGKESVRDEVLGEMVHACGAKWHKEDACWKLRGKMNKQPITLQTHHDHRMAMAFALLAICQQEIVLSEMESVKKSFPHYWIELNKLGFTVRSK